MRIVTLTQAQVTHFEGYGLLGFLDVEYDGRERKYVFKLPTTANPTPPGWSTIEQLTGVTAQQIIDSYDAAGESNTAASAAVLELISRYRGEKFLATEVPNQDGVSSALELTLLDVEAAAPKLVSPELDAREATPAAAAPAPRYVLPVHIAREIPAPGEGPSGIRILFGSVEMPEASLFIAAPDATDRSPPDWWFVATFTGIASERVANGWDRRGNEPLDDAVRLLGLAITGHAAPILPDGNVDLDLWRRQLIQKRLACGTKPFVFLGRPDHNSLHTRKIFRDCAHDFLFRTNVDPGNSFGAPALIVSVDGRVKLLHLDDDDMLQVILNRFIRFATSGRPPRPRNPPKALLTDLIRLPDTSLPTLKGIVRIPTVREDGSIIMTSGYDMQSQLWYAPEFELEPIPERPTTRDLQEAKALILTPFAEFPFVSEADRAGTLACLFEQILLPMIQGPRPFFIFDAPEHGQGTGKSLIAKTIQTIITGYKQPFTTALGKREEEIEKRITGLLRDAKPFIIVDNLSGAITSDSLAQLATSERWQARLLNTNEVPIYAQLATWAFTLNAAHMSRDIARRAVLIQLDTKLAVAWERSNFKIKNVDRWARVRRASIIRACLMLTRAWVLDGRPADPTVVRGSFESWCEVIGGVLHHAGFDGLAQALRATGDRDASVEDHRVLMQAWAAKFGLDQPIPAYSVGLLAAEYGLYADKMPKRTNNMAVGRAMSQILWGGLIGQCIDGRRIEVSPTILSGYTGYTLVAATTSVPIPPRPRTRAASAPS